MIDITIVLESRAFFSKLPSALHCGYPMFPVRMRKAWFLHFLTFLIAHLLMNSSKGVFEWCSSTESETFSLFICPDTSTFRTLSVFALLETICPKFCAKPLLYTCQLFLRYKREIFILGVLGFQEDDMIIYEDSRRSPKSSEEVRSLPKTSEVFRRRPKSAKGEVIEKTLIHKDRR